ncbi:hypothetical protein [Mycobacterium hippophais]
MTKRLTVWLAGISALMFITPNPAASAAIDTAHSSIPVNPTTTLEMHVTANCIAAESNCLWNTAANLRAPEGVIGFPGDAYGRQTTTVRTMDRGVWVETQFVSPNTRLFKSQTYVELSTVYFGGGPPEKFTVQGNTWPTDWRTGQHRNDVPLIVCAHIQVVYAGVNLTSPDACAQASFN